MSEISALEQKEDGSWLVLAAPEKAYKLCNNYNAGMCNWMVPVLSLFPQNK